MRYFLACLSILSFSYCAFAPDDETYSLHFGERGVVLFNNSPAKKTQGCKFPVKTKLPASSGIHYEVQLTPYFQEKDLDTIELTNCVIEIRLIRKLDGAPQGEIALGYWKHDSGPLMVVNRTPTHSWKTSAEPKLLEWGITPYDLVPLKKEIIDEIKTSSRQMMTFFPRPVLDIWDAGEKPFEFDVYTEWFIAKLMETKGKQIEASARQAARANRLEDFVASLSTDQASSLQAEREDLERKIFDLKVKANGLAPIYGGLLGAATLHFPLTHFVGAYPMADTTLIFGTASSLIVGTAAILGVRHGYLNLKSLGFLGKATPYRLAYVSGILTTASWCAYQLIASIF